MSRRTLVLSAIALSSLATAACAGLLGIDDQEYTGPQQPELEAGPGAEAGGSDALPPVDGAPEAASCVGVDLTSDPKNCGACGRECGASQPYVRSACGPTVIASGVALGPALASDGTAVYWSTPSGTPVAQAGIRRCSAATGCGNLAVVFANQRPSATTYITLGRNNVYWREESGGLYTCPKTLPTGQLTCAPRHLADFVPPTATFVESTDGFVYWAQSDAANGAGIWRVAIDQSDAGPYIFNAQPGTQPITALLSLPPSLFWAKDNQLWACTSLNGSPCAGGGGGFGGAPVVPMGPTQSLSAGDAGIYWSESVSGGGVRALRGNEAGTGPTVATITAGDAGTTPGLVVAREGHVYFSTSDGVLMRCLESGCTAATLLVLAYDPNIRPVIAVDASYVYWLSVPAGAGATGSILRVPK